MAKAAKRRQQSSQDDRVDRILALIHAVTGSGVVAYSPDGIKLGEIPGPEPVRITLPVERAEALERAGIDLTGLSDKEREFLLTVEPFHYGYLVAVAEAQDLHEAKELARALGADPEILAAHLKGAAPRWCESLLELVQFDVEPELIERYWAKAPLTDKIEAAIQLRRKEAPQAEDYYQRAWLEFDEAVYTPKLMPLLLGIEEAPYLARRAAVYSVADPHQIRGPEWVVAAKEAPLTPLATLKGRRLGSKKQKTVKVPIVRLDRPLRDVEEATDLLMENTFVLRTRKKWAVILCPFASELYVISPDGVVTTPTWDEYVRAGVSFVYNYVAPDDAIKYVGVNPKSKAALRLLLDREQVANLLQHFGYDSKEKLDDFPPDVAEVMLRLQRKPMTPVQHAQQHAAVTTTATPEPATTGEEEITEQSPQI